MREPVGERAKVENLCFDRLAHVIQKEVHDNIACRIFMTAVGNAFDGASVCGVPLLVVGIIRDQGDSLARELAIQPVAGLGKAPDLFKIFLADPGAQGFPGCRLAGRTMVSGYRWNMKVDLFRTIKQKGKFVWPHPSHVSLLPKLPSGSGDMIARPSQEAMAEMYP